MLYLAQASRTNPFIQIILAPKAADRSGCRKCGYNQFSVMTVMLPSFTPPAPEIRASVNMDRSGSSRVCRGEEHTADMFKQRTGFYNKAGDES